MLIQHSDPNSIPRIARCPMQFRSDFPHVRLARILLSLLAVCCHSSGIVSAGTISWTNLSGGNWSVAANWNPNQIPVAADFAMITNAGTYAVTLDVDATVAGLSLGGASGKQTLTKNGATLTLNNASIVNSNGVFGYSGGPLDGNGLLTVEGLLNWTAGSISSPIMVASNGVLNSDGTVLRNLFGVLTNAGLLRVSKSGQLNIYGGPIVNLAGGVIDFEVNADWYGVPAATIRNAGTFRKTGGNGDVILGYPISFPILFENTGSVSAQSGTLNFYGAGGEFGGNFEVSASGAALIFNDGGNLTGSFTAAAGATITLSQTFPASPRAFTSGPLVSFNGGGVSQMIGGHLTLLNNVIPNLQMLGGTVSLGPAFQGGSITNLTLPGAKLNGDHTVSGTFNCGGGVSGSLVVASGGTLNWTGTGEYDVGRDILGSLTVASNGVVNFSRNALTHLFGSLTNAGLIRFTSASTGQFNVHGGRIENLAGGVVDFEADGSCAGVPAVTFHNAGTLRKSGGSGTRLIGDPSFPILFENIGTVEAQSGRISFQTDFTQYPSAVVAISIGGTTPGNYGHIHFTNALTAAGSFSVSTRNGFRPNPGDSFDVLSYPSATNEFVCLSGLDLGGGLLLIPHFNPTSLALTASTYATNATQPQLFIERSPNGVLVTWSSGFPGWILEGATNLSAAVWDPVPATCNNQAIVPTIHPQHYFRLRQ